MDNRPARQKSPGELAAYRLGLAIGAGEAQQTQRRTQRRREAHFYDNEVVLVEQEVIEEVINNTRRY